MIKKKKKVTLAMIKKAEAIHWRREDHASLRRQHALMYLRAKQTGDTKMVKHMEKIPGLKISAKKIRY